TANIGLRYDKQTGKNEARTVRANPIFPDILPSVTYNGGDAGFDWTSITPRLGLTYALGPERKTLLRASYSRFADQLGNGGTYQLNPLTLNSYAYFYIRPNGPGNIGRGDVVDQNGNGVLDLGDVIGFSGNVNPFTRGLLQSNGVDPSLDPQKTDE